MPLEYKILITGGNGYIAKSLHRNLSGTHDVTSITRSNFDLTNYNKTCEWFSDKIYDVVIHTAISGGSRLELDEHSVFDQNMAMFNNLVANKHCFSKLISFGSGAELFYGDTPYANSKREIAKFIQTAETFYNLRIFGLFDENELSTRFIKSNILRYINKEPIIIHANKIMDFFYMKDLISLVNYYIENTNLPKEINCSYQKKNTLLNVANIINKLDSYTVPVVLFTQDTGNDYFGRVSENLIPSIGTEVGIIETYNKLCINNNGDIL